MKENSPPFQRWENGPMWNKSRQGRQKPLFLSSLTGLLLFNLFQPSVETLGYFLSSLRDSP
ncbi:MAG: hypothetical protein C5B50_21665 [Verrucomicrobia bacterium]|nr:MAG: hypothetical protein C5B50_21665 [Verrucomicrobiota bacterium]